MRFSIIAFLGLAAVATAQNVTQASSSTSQVASATSTSLSPQQTCLAKCGAADICCQAACVNVPCPSQLQANATTECAAQCPQGNGTQSETQQYAACQARCVSSYFMSTGTVAAATGTSASGPAKSGATTTEGSATGTGTGSGSATASATHNAAPEVRFGAAGLGLLGLVVAGLAL